MPAFRAEIGLWRVGFDQGSFPDLPASLWVRPFIQTRGSSAVLVGCIMTEEPDSEAVSVQMIDLGSIIDFSDDAIVGITDDGVISSYNRAAARLYGHRPQEIIGQNAEMLVPPRFRVEQAAALRQAMSGEHMPSLPVERLCRDGTTVTVIQTLSTIRDSSDTVIGAAAIAHRIPEIRKIGAGEPGQRAPSDGEADDSADARGAIVNRDEKARDGRQVAVEKVRKALIGSGVNGRAEAVLDQEHIQERAQIRQAHDRLRLRMDEERARERVAVRRAQDQFQARIGVEWTRERVRVEEAQDRFQVAIEAGRAQAQANSEFVQAQLYEGQRLEALGKLAGGIAHDFNNVLAVILNYAGFVSEALTSGSRSELEAAELDVEQLQQAAERARSLTRQLLAFARREIIEPLVINMNHVVAEVEHMLRRTIGANIALSTDLDADLNLVLGDAGQIEHVLVNLAVNARDAMAGGGTLRIDTANAVIAVTTDVRLKPGRYVRLRVHDTGTGMPAETRDRVFEPFFTTKSVGLGTGLGLSTVYGIVTQAGGAITIESEPGAGTTFTILWPATDEVVASGKSPISHESVPAGETVLIVEDEEALRGITERIFGNAGYHVLTAGNGADAVRLATEYDGAIHLLLSDVVMPAMLGKEAVELIRQIRPDIEVLFMSSSGDPVLAAQGKLDPDVNLIEKPFNASTVLERARKILNGRPEL